MWFKYYKGYYDVRKLELELVSLEFPSDRTAIASHHPEGFPSPHKGVS